MQVLLPAIGSSNWPLYQSFSIHCSYRVSSLSQQKIVDYRDRLPVNPDRCIDMRAVQHVSSFEPVVWNLHAVLICFRVITKSQFCQCITSSFYCLSGFRADLISVTFQIWSFECKVDRRFFLLLESLKHLEVASSYTSTSSGQIGDTLEQRIESLKLQSESQSHCHRSKL